MRTLAEMSKDVDAVTLKIASNYILCAVSVLYLRSRAEIQVTVNGANGILMKLKFHGKRTVEILKQLIELGSMILSREQAFATVLIKAPCAMLCL